MVFASRRVIRLSLWSLSALCFACGQVLIESVDSVDSGSDAMDAAVPDVSLDVPDSARDVPLDLSDSAPDVPPLTGDTFEWGFDDASEYTVNEGQADITSSILSVPSVAQHDAEWMPGEFEGGTTSGTRWNDAASALELAAVDAGTFTSRIIDAGGEVEWSSLGVSPERPSGKSQPNVDESGYTFGNQSVAGLVLLNRFDSAGATITDLSPFVHTGTNNGGTGAPGLFGRALSLGVSDWVGYGDPPAATVTGDFTVSVWVLRNMLLGGDQFIVSKESMPVGAGWCLYFDSSNRVTFCTGEVPIRDTITTATFESTTRWYHIVGVHMRGSQRIFVDGVEQALSAGGAWDVNLGVSAYDLEVGRRYSDDSWLEGAVDDLALFSRALTDMEIEEIYLRGATSLRYQVRACEAPDCSGTTFGGPLGASTQWYSEETNTLAGPPTFSFPMPRMGRYFQYRVEFERTNTTESPRLLAAELGPAHLYAGRTVVSAAATASFVRLTGFRQTTTPAHRGRVAFQVSLGDGRWWFARDGAWAEVGSDADTSVIEELDAASSTFHTAVGAGQLSIRLIVESPLGVAEIGVDEVSVGLEL